MMPSVSPPPRHPTRRRITAFAGVSLSGMSLSRSALGSSIDGKGISNADVLSGFEALRTAPMRFQNGQTFSVDQFRGRALLVNFWANWCVNCIAEFGSMLQLQQAAGGVSQFATVLVSQPKDWDRDQAMARQQNIPFPLAVVAEPATAAGTAATAAMLMGNVVDRTARFGLPVCYLVSRRSQVVFAGSGGMNWVSQQAMIKAAQALKA